MTAVSSHYRSKDGDVLDQIVRAHYGSAGPDVMAAVLDANPDLAKLGPVLPAMVDITLPAYQPKTETGPVALWA